jgi:hypothetical protein
LNIAYRHFQKLYFHGIFENFGNHGLIITIP